MIANARMYSVSPEAAALWRGLLQALVSRSHLPISVIEHAPPAPIEQLWQRTDKAAVFMCGLPYARCEPRPQLLAAPVPSAADFHASPQYWSELIVRADSGFHTIEDTFGHRLAFTTPQSQSGFAAALFYFMDAGGDHPLFREIIAPQMTPQGALMAVAAGMADVAPIDSYAFALLQKFMPELTARVRVVARTAPTPIPPLVSSYTDLESLASAFLKAHEDDAMKPLLEGLLLQRFGRPDPASYDRLRLNFEASMRYWREHPLASATHPAFTMGPAGRGT